VRQNQCSQHTALWDDLLVLGAGASIPWILLGDFNIVLAQQERLSQVLFLSERD